MNYHHAWAAKGQHAYGGRHLHVRSLQRAAVNIYKTDDSFEMLVFAPGRIKEHFHLDVQGSQLTVSYQPPEGFPRPDWVVREYSRGGFERKFNLDDSIETSKISAKYTDGVLQVSLPFTKTEQANKQEIAIS